MTLEAVIDQSNGSIAAVADSSGSQSNDEQSAYQSISEEQLEESNSQTSLVFIPCSSKTETSPDSPENCQVKLPPHLQKRLLSSKSCARTGKSKEDLENEQKKAEERRQKLHLEAKKRREELDLKMKCVMVNYDFICKQHMIRKGVKIEGEHAASMQELNHAVRTVNMQMNDLNAGLRKNLNEAMKDAMKL